jgi:hypothetical protein
LEEDCDGNITIKNEYEDENNGKIAAALVEAIIEQESNEAGGVQQQRILTSNIALGSLLKYDTPISLRKEATGTGEELRDAGTPVPAVPAAPSTVPGICEHDVVVSSGTAPLEPTAEEAQLLQQGSSSAGGAAGGSSASTAVKRSMQQVIDMILPPLLWEQDGELWMQQVGFEHRDSFKQQLQVNVPVGTRILGDKYHLSPQTLCPLYTTPNGIYQLHRKLYASSIYCDASLGETFYSIIR